MSYRITIDGKPFCSSQFDHSQLLDPKVAMEANKSGSLTFTMLPDHPYYDGITFRQNIFDVYLNDELIFEGIPVSEATDFYNRKTVVCEGELTFLNDTIQRQAVYQNQTVASLLGEYLTVHNNQADLDKQFTVGTVTVDGGNSIYRYTNYNTTMQEIQDDLVQNFGGFFRVRHSGGTRYLDYLDSSPHTSSQIIRIGKNLVDLATNLSSLDICTVLIPLGAKTGNQVIDGLDERLTVESVNNGKDYILGTAESIYGNVWATHVWDEITTAAALLQKGEDYLDDAQWSNLVIEATAFDLGLATDTVEQFHVLDMIRVTSEPHGIDRYFMLTKMDIDLDHPANTKITLGKDMRLSLSAQTARSASEIERQESRIMVNASSNAREILDSATDGAIQILYNQDGVAYEMRINNSQNPATATKWWRYNSGGWGYTADGGQTYVTAATMDGSLLATLITTGILKSDDGTTFYLDLDNGVLKGNFSELKISGKAGATQAYADQAEADAVSTAASNTSSAISTYDTNLNQLAVFNKLTNNQANQGIYLSNGNLYIRASMIGSDYISSNVIQANSIAVSKLTGSLSIATTGNNWSVDLTNGTMNIGTLAVSKITGSKSLGSNWSIDFDTGTITIGTINADNINGGTISSSDVNVTGSSTTDGKVTVKYTQGTYTYKSILKPAMLVNSLDIGSSSHEEADVRYDRLVFVDGSTELSSYEDVACTVKSTNGSYVTILPPSASGKYITIQPVVVSTW